MPTKKLLDGHTFIQAMVSKGIIPENSTHVIIDASAMGIVLIHYSAVGTTDLLAIVEAAAEPAKVVNQK